MPGPTPTPTPPTPTPTPTPEPTPTPMPTPTGEGDAFGPPDESTTALSEVADEPILTDIESGAAQLLSTAAPDGLSNPFSSAQGGWLLDAQQVNPYTNVASTSGTPDPFVGWDVNPYTNVAADGANANAFTGGQNVNMYSGVQNTAWSTGGGDAAGESPKGAPTGLDAAVDRIINDVLGAADEVQSPNIPSGTGSPVNVSIAEPKSFQITVIDVPLSSTPPQPPPPNPQSEQGTTTSDLRLNIAMQEASGPYDPNVLTPGQPATIRDVLSGTDWMSLLGNPESRSTSLNDSQPSPIRQILSGTYADSVLQMQLSSEGVVPGSFVSPARPNDYLFNPNATTLVEAMLFASHSPNTRLLQAQSLQLGASMAPIIGSVSTWMNPHSGWFAKGIAIAGLLPMVSETAALGSVSEAATLSAEADAAGEALALAEGKAAAGSLPQELQDTLPSIPKEAATNLQHVFAGGSGDRGIGVLHLDVSKLKLTAAEVASTVDAIRDMDFQAGMAGGLVRTAVPSRSIADSVAALGQRALSLGSTEAAGHLPDLAGGGSPLGPIMGMLRSVNSSIGGQWRRYAPGFTFEGFSLIDSETGEFLYTSHALENPPAGL